MNKSYDCPSATEVTPKDMKWLELVDYQKVYFMADLIQCTESNLP